MMHYFYASKKTALDIQLSKKKLIKNAFLSCVLVALSAWMLLMKKTEGNSFIYIPAVRYTAGIAGILFFGVATVIHLRKLGETEPGVIINEEGITDNSSALKVGMIPWKDVSGLKAAKVMRQQFLMVVVNNPDEYIARQPSAFKRKSMEYNLRQYGSPIALNAVALDCNLQELAVHVESAWAAYKANHQQTPG
jgi:hypothetical protein